MIKGQAPIIIASAIVGGIIVLFLIANMQVKVQYQDTETYTVQEPYQVQVEKPLSYQDANKGTKKLFSLSLGEYVQGSVDIANSDTQPGTFVVDCNFRALQNTYTDNERIYIIPGETKTIVCEADTSAGEDIQFSYSITPGTKTVTETKYRTVEKSRVVIKEKEVSLYKKILGDY